MSGCAAERSSSINKPVLAMKMSKLLARLRSADVDNELHAPSPYHCLERAILIDIQPDPFKAHEQAGGECCRLKNVIRSSVNPMGYRMVKICQML